MAVYYCGLCYEAYEGLLLLPYRIIIIIIIIILLDYILEHFHMQ